MSETIRLYTFTLSHFCEKARWALDRSGASYREIILMPGFHRARMKALGGCGQVPLLTCGDRVVEGSGAILDFADALGAPAGSPSVPALTPGDPALRAEALVFPKRILAALDRQDDDAYHLLFLQPCASAEEHFELVLAYIGRFITPENAKPPGSSPKRAS